MFQVKSTLVSFLGDEEKYPCHFCHKIGDEIVFDGERYIGRLCPDVWPMLTQKVAALHQAGPRYVEPHFYYPIWYVPPSIRDESRKKLDGLGFASVLKTHTEPRCHMANLVPSNAFKWPPHPERTVAKQITVLCPDTRTSAVFVLEAFDLSEKGFDVPFFRRQMAILDRVLKDQPVPLEAILERFSKSERDEIYPPLVEELLIPLLEEVELMGYLETTDGRAFVTKRGESKLEKFKQSLTQEELDGLGM